MIRDESAQFREKIDWLRYNGSPKEQVAEFMKETAVGRHSNIIKDSLSVKATLEAYPRLITHPGMVSS